MKVAQNMPFCSLECSILPGQFRGRTQLAHWQSTRNQLDALHNHIQSLLLSSLATEAICWAVFTTTVLCIILSLLCFVLCTLLPLLHVRYLPDGRFSTSHTGTHTHTAVLPRTQLVAQNTMRIRENALLDSTYLPLTSRSLAVFCLRRKTVWTNTELSLFNRNNLEIISFLPFQN